MKRRQRARQPGFKRRGELLRRSRLTHHSRVYPARRFVVHPDPNSPLVVEVRVARSKRAMLEAMTQQEGKNYLRRADVGFETAGLCRHWRSAITGMPAIRPRGIVARIYFNERDLRQRPTEIITHECGHAAMAWARLRRANLGYMAGEEVMCYALGRIAKQVVNHLYALGAIG